ncbi:uncharacterized protein TNCV_3355681 [Trichonephila clavipes]|nr:uncharacterized protein TNCV_3355681 [Trichonephila clavipes]
MQTYKLDPCWYFTTPALSWDAMLLHTKVAIELFTDYDMLLFIEKGVRGGISQCCNRYAIANNRYMSNFNPDDEIKYLMYLDANNLYGYAMSKYLPLKDFVWSDNDLTEQDILNLSDESDVGYILEVDLEYPSDLHDKHSDFPLAPENKPPPNCKEPRLLTTLEPKTKYVLHYSNLKLYLKLGRKQFNSPPQLENQSQCRRKTTQLVSRNETTELNRRKQLNSSVGTKQLKSALPSTACNRLQRLQPRATAYNKRLQPPATAYNRLQPPATACNRLHRLYSRIGFFYLLRYKKVSLTLSEWSVQPPSNPSFFILPFTSHNYTPLRSAIQVLGTLQEVFFCNGAQKPRHVSLDVRNYGITRFSHP